MSASTTDRPPRPNIPADAGAALRVIVVNAPDAALVQRIWELIIEGELARRAAAPPDTTTAEPTPPPATTPLASPGAA
jgi:hypothetical protein